MSTKAQLKTYKFEKVVLYELKSDFYSDYLRILSTKNDNVSLLIVATPMGNEATLNIGKNHYVVYSNDGKLFKLDIEATLEKNKYRLDTNPSILLSEMEPDIKILKTSETGSFEGKRYSIYKIMGDPRKGSDSVELGIDTASALNTVPFLMPSLDIKGLVYSVGTHIKLKSYGNVRDILKKEEEPEDSDKKKITDFVIQFDQAAAIQEYKKAYLQKKATKDTLPVKKATKRH